MSGASRSSSDDAIFDSSMDPVQKPSKLKASVKLPEKYEILDKFFNSMVSSIRLLRLKGSVSIFKNICPKVESLTDRRFSHSCLAQLKYLLPEAISIKKVLIHDEMTCCMKPDLQISLQTSVFEDSRKGKNGSEFLVLSKVFRARLVEFHEAHPEVDEVPEETLPEPFSQAKRNIPPPVIVKPSKPSLPVEFPSGDLSGQHIAAPSHLSGSFRRRFCQKVPVPDTQKTKFLGSISPSTVSTHPIVNPSSSTVPYLTKCLPEPPLSNSLPNNYLSFSTQEENTELMKTTASSSPEAAVGEETPSKLNTPARLMTVTPDLQTPKRSFLTPNSESTTPVKRSVARRVTLSNFFSPTKKAKLDDEQNEEARSSDGADILSFLPKSLLESVREKERKAKWEKEAGVAEAKRRRQMVASLPKLFDMIRLIFQSVKRSVITKQELMHKIIVSHCDVVDKSEVEEQLKLLEELAPDWISAKLVSTGDYLYRINNTSSPDSIRQKLSEAS
ncbi:hypothetical protein QJS10_CPB18g01648 [Acorus calamus]|uniref:CDT1 Geminin-binding domain-containing protein n=1 Tax=Acorus calamus TaxID=4465 RepID=A0AAV9CM55_ACOCL|nr:hypothetical protein QJS10_CPB18g01648 [Acorus calamus]